MKKILLLLLLGACSTLDKDVFFDDIAGFFDLTETGVGYIRREMRDLITEPIDIGTKLEIRGDGSVTLILSSSSSQKIAQFIELELPKQGVFQLEVNKKYAAWGVEGNLLIATTNSGEFSPDDVLFEHLVPIAVKSIQDL